MVARRGLAEDLIEIGSRLSGKTSVAVAVGAALALHVVAVMSPAPAPVAAPA